MTGAPPGGLTARRAASPRQLVVAVVTIASAAVAGTSFAAAPAGLLLAGAAAWLVLLGIAAFGERAGRWALTTVSVVLRLATIALLAWYFARPASPVGAHDLLSWVPIGVANAASGLWLLRVVRRRAA